VAKQFGLGYSPSGWRTLAGVFPQYDDPLLVESGLVILSQEDGEDEKRYDRFRDRVMFPIRNVKGECIGFGGRVLGDEKPKYLNSPETPVFSKGRELYGLFEARQALREHGFALVTEGYMDVVALAQLGFPNAVATLGTACTTDHVQKLFRFTDAVVFSFDGDAAGRRAARKALDAALPFATDVRSVKFLFLPAEHDPDSFIREHGKESFSRYISEAVPLSRFLIDAARDGCDLSSAEGRAMLASNAKPLWMTLPDGALKRQLLTQIAGLVQLGNRELMDLWLSASSLNTPGNPGRYKFGSYSGKYGAGNGPFLSPNPGFGQSTGTRTRPTSRADIAARLILANLAAWDDLSGEDHAMLCEQPAPHGPLFTWLEAQVHEHGHLPWGALQEGLRGHAGEPLALRLMSGPELVATTAEPNPQEARAELRQVLNRMLVERIDAQMSTAIAASRADPTELQRYRALQQRRAALIGLAGNTAPA
jgi:DNA primase